MLAQCETCKFWQQLPDDIEVGICRRHAPMAVVPKFRESDFWRVEAVWPATCRDDWCGEFVKADTDDSLIPKVCCECGGTQKVDYDGTGETNCPICNSLDTTKDEE